MHQEKLYVQHFRIFVVLDSPFLSYNFQMGFSPISYFDEVALVEESAERAYPLNPNKLSGFLPNGLPRNCGTLFQSLFGHRGRVGG